MGQPLGGRRVLVTRARHQASKLSEGLRELGAEPVEVPVLEIQPPVSWQPLEAALHRIDSYHWLVFTSSNAVEAVLNRIAVARVPIAHSRAKIAAVGQTTAAALENAGFKVDYVPEKYVAESLVETFPDDVEAKRFLLARAETARDVIPAALRAHGATVDVVDAYRNGIPASAPEDLSRALILPLDGAAFTSSSTVSHLAQTARSAGVPFPFPGVRAISIGPVTSQTLRESGWPPAAEANPHDVPGLIAAIRHVLEPRS